MKYIVTALAVVALLVLATGVGLAAQQPSGGAGSATDQSSAKGAPSQPARVFPPGGSRDPNQQQQGSSGAASFGTRPWAYGSPPYYQRPWAYGRAPYYRRPPVVYYPYYVVPQPYWYGPYYGYGSPVPYFYRPYYPIYGF
jgi:hypothetical protein